jgi:hypothetical protein
MDEKEPEKRGPSRPRGSRNWAISRAGTGTEAPRDAMEVDSLASRRPLVKRPRQATLSFGVAG